MLHVGKVRLQLYSTVRFIHFNLSIDFLMLDYHAQITGCVCVCTDLQCCTGVYVGETVLIQYDKRFLALAQPEP